MEGQDIRAILLETLLELEPNNSMTGNLQSSVVLRAASNKIPTRGIDQERALLTVWHDLFRTGYLAWGHNLSNPEPPFCHITDKGRKVLKNVSRDPSNPDGYLSKINDIGGLNRLAASYLDEALECYNSGLYRSSAVMLGVCTESIVIEFRNVLKGHIRKTGKECPDGLDDWKIKKVLTGIKSFCDLNKKTMDSSLLSAYESFWPAFTQQIRASRNDAGHPSDLEVIGNDTVHASLLIFPELLTLKNNLENWVKS